MKRKFPAFLILVDFLSNGFYKKPQHVATLSFNQQLVFEISSIDIYTDFSATIQFLKSCRKFLVLDLL